MADFFLDICFLSFVGSIISVFIILSKNKILKLCGGKAFYRICTLASFFFLIPIPTPAIINIRLQAIDDGKAFIGEKITEIASHSLFFNGLKPVISVMDLLARIWLLGIFISIVLLSYRYLRFKNYIKNGIGDNNGIQSIFDQVKNDMGIQSDISLYVNSAIKSPMIIGIYKFSIIMPNKEIAPEDLYLIFRHELTHFKNKDHWYKVIASVIFSFHWFNPITYILNKNIQEACEYACDEAVTVDMTIPERQYYSEMLLNFMSITNMTYVLSSPLSKNKKILLRRFQLIMERKMFSKGKKITLITVICIMVFALAIGVNALAKVDTTGGKNIKITTIDQTKYIEDTNNETISSNELSGNGEIHDLSLFGPVMGKFNLSSEGVKLLDLPLVTNSTQITISFKDINDAKSINIYLFHDEDVSDPILYGTLDKNKKQEVFSSLVSSNAYRVGILSDTLIESDIELIITE